jgi:hypothetical protein
MDERNWYLGIGDLKFNLHVKEDKDALEVMLYDGEETEFLTDGANNGFGLKQPSLKAVFTEYERLFWNRSDFAGSQTAPKITMSAQTLEKRGEAPISIAPTTIIIL